MVRLEFRLPDIGEGIAEAEVVEWLAETGDTVAEGQVVVSVMTDKATVEMAAPAAGRLSERGGEAGEMVAIGAVLFVLETQGEGDAPQAQPARTSLATEPAPVPKEAPRRATAEDHPVLAAPAVRRRARELGIDLAEVPIHGEHVRHEDLDRYLLGRQSHVTPVLQRDSGGEDIPLTGLRRQIARRMEEAKRRIPHFTYVEEVDVTELEILRQRLNAERGERSALHLLPFVIAALCRALREFPALNAHFDDARDIITRFDAIDIGIATQTDNGLMVPVLRDAGALDLWQIAECIADLAMRTRAGEIAREDLSGSTITVTSLGKLGGIAATPIANRPEVAILAPHRVLERCVWADGVPVPRKIMNLSISCDHRIIDGYVAAAFVQAIKRLLEAPAPLAVR